MDNHIKILLCSAATLLITSPVGISAKNDSLLAGTQLNYDYNDLSVRGDLIVEGNSTLQGTTTIGSQRKPALATIHGKLICDTITTTTIEDSIISVGHHTIKSTMLESATGAINITLAPYSTRAAATDAEDMRSSNNERTPIKYADVLIEASSIIVVNGSPKNIQNLWRVTSSQLSTYGTTTFELEPSYGPLAKNIINKDNTRKTQNREREDVLGMATFNNKTGELKIALIGPDPIEQSPMQNRPAKKIYKTDAVPTFFSVIGQIIHVASIANHYCEDRQETLKIDPLIANLFNDENNTKPSANNDAHNNDFKVIGDLFVRENTTLAGATTFGDHKNPTTVNVYGKTQAEVINTQNLSTSKYSVGSYIIKNCLIESETGIISMLLAPCLRHYDDNEEERLERSGLKHYTDCVLWAFQIAPNHENPTLRQDSWIFPSRVLSDACEITMDLYDDAEFTVTTHDGHPDNTSAENVTTNKTTHDARKNNMLLGQAIFNNKTGELRISLVEQDRSNYQKSNPILFGATGQIITVEQANNFYQEIGESHASHVENEN